MRAVRWSPGHRDIYIYYDDDDVWIKIACQMYNKSKRCTTPDVLSRGQCPGTAIRDTYQLAIKAEQAIAKYKHRKETKSR